MKPFPISVRFSGILFNLGLGITLAGGLIYTSHLVTKSFERMKSTIEVKGYAESKVRSDYANWSVRITVRDQTLSTAYEKLDHDIKIVEDFLKTSKIQDLKLERDPVGKNLLYDRDVNGNTLSTVNGYELDQTLSFTTMNLDEVKDLSTSIDVLGRQGIEIAVSSPVYLVEREKLESLKKDLLTKATQSAKERAELFAQNSGTKIGGLISARQGIFQVTSESSTDVSDYGSYDTRTIDKVVKIVVTLSYQTER